MIKLLIGGSPCTYWSIAQSTEKRETEPSGMGWELFKNYLIAKEKYKPDYFLYENNYSMDDRIRDEITKQLGVEPIMINSALLSAQNRKRYYWTNIPNVTQPEDKGILLKDILESGIDLTQQEKGYCLTSTYNGAVAWNTIERNQRTMVAESITVSGYRLKKYDEYANKHDNTIPEMFNAYNCAEIKDKSPTITANCGGTNTSSTVLLFDKSTGGLSTYEVKDGKITIKGKTYLKAALFGVCCIWYECIVMIFVVTV